MISKVKIHPKSETGTMCECICASCQETNYLFLQEQKSPFLNGILSIDPTDFKCRKCDTLLMSSAAVDTAYRSFLMGEDYVVSLYFKSYGVVDVDFTPDVPRIMPDTVIAKQKAALTFWTRLRGAYRKSANAVKKVPLFVVSAVRAANRIGMSDDDKI